jgi:HEAT repeat protein
MKKLLGSAVLLLLLVSICVAEDVPALIKRLKSDDSEARRAAAKTFSEIGEEGKPAIPNLIDALKKDKDLYVRRYAAEALGKLGMDAKSAVPALAVALKDPKKEVGEAAAEALGNMGKDAVKPLADLLKSGSPPPPPKGKETKKKGPPPDNDNNEVRRKAAEALGKIGPDAKEAVDALIGALRDPGCRAEAAAALGSIGPDAKKAIGPLQNLIDAKGANKRDAVLRKVVNEAIAKIQKS